MILTSVYKVKMQSKNLISLATHRKNRRNLVNYYAEQRVEVMKAKMSKQKSYCRKSCQKKIEFEALQLFLAFIHFYFC